MSTCNEGLRSIIRRRIICLVSCIRRKSEMSSPASRCSSVAICSNTVETVTLLQMGGEDGRFLGPLFCCPKVWHQNHIPVMEHLNSFFVEAPVLATCGEPKEIRHEVGCYQAGLLTFHQHDGGRRCGKQMFSKQALLQMEIWQFQFRVYPADPWYWFFDTVSVQRVIAHQLAFLIGRYHPCLSAKRRWHLPISWKLPPYSVQTVYWTHPFR